MKKQADKTCKHEETIFGICLICKHDTGAIERLNEQRKSVMGKFEEIGKKVAAK